MAAPDIETIYGFELAFEDAAETFLNTATSITVLGTLNADVMTTPRINVRLEVGAALDPLPQRGGGASPTTLDYRNFDATFYCEIITDNAAGQVGDHPTIRKQCRQALAVSGANWTSGNLPYYDLNYCRPAGTEYDADGDFNVSVLQYTVIFSIRDDAWPA